MKMMGGKTLRKLVLTSLSLAMLGGAEAGVGLVNVEPASIRQNGSRVSIDLGKVWFGNIEINAGISNAGRSVSLIMKESSQPGPLPSTGPEAIGVRFFKSDLTLREGTNKPVLREEDKRLMPPEVGAVMPFRYIEIDGWQGAFSKANIQVKAAVADTWQERGRMVFSGSADAYWLNRIWSLSSHTMAATSFADIFVDGDRERLPYEADGYINQLGWYATAGESSVPRRTFEWLIENPNWPTEWQSHMIFMAWADYMHTGDIAFLRKHYDRLGFLTLHDLIGPNDLISTKNITERFKKESRLTYPMGDIVDWPKNQRDGYVMGDVNAATNAMAYQGFVLMAKIAKVLDKSEDEQRWQADAKRIRTGLERLRLANGFYADSPGTQHTSAHSIFLPLAYGLVEGADKARYIRRLNTVINGKFRGGFPGSVYTAPYLLEALFENGQDDLAVALILNNSDRGWRNMLQKYEATVAHEAWDVKFKDNEDWTHAWGAAPAYILPRYLLGVQQLVPGWARWRIRPSKALNASVEAWLPLPQGTAYVKLDKNNGTATVRVPAGTVAEFVDGGETRNLTAGEHEVRWKSYR
ncbi:MULTISPECIES: family 78 glycoside hydrolase catalytic domain [unclassified Cupriavidus]|uniref:alpha-L-rhamnosidase-related protein n=1 Tax=unclassified Cupriavidus TaxID=2640874 RepID=UPI0010F6434A|nr:MULTISPECIES: family 78 glycoside hydrolase catalytic domain [unclassified Cupriavidus]MWL88188.1 Bacterial alpha-L-rhamnosidase [Cupriavidus sp. SW-Y-13]